MDKRAKVIKPVGELISKLMQEAGVNLATLADRTKLSQGYLSDLVHGKMDNPSLDVLLKIAEALDSNFIIRGARKEEGHLPAFESSFSAEELEEEFGETVLERIEVDVSNPAVKLVSRLLSDPEIPVHRRKQMEKHIIKLVKWLQEVIEEEEENGH